VQSVDNKLAVLAVENQADLPKHAQVVRNVRHLLPELFGKVADSAWSGAQASNDAKSFRVRKRFEKAGAVLRV
jgi:hypothetical protein